MATLNVCEIFYSLQGESSYAGMPCAFIRLSGCNLRCSYCDTVYSFAPGKDMSVSQIVEAVAKYPTRLVEITGGEPLYQDDLPELIEALNEAGWEILVETNGSLYIGDLPDYAVKIVDVKCPGSACGGSFMNWNLKLLGPRDEIKFVLSSYEDYSFAREFIRRNALTERIVHLSPVLSVLPAETLAEWMLVDGIKARLQLQLHKILALK